MIKEHTRHRLERLRARSIDAPLEHQRPTDYQKNAMVDCGWGRLIFSQTFDDQGEIAEALREERPGKRDIAFYLREPHVTLSMAPQELFLDPSHSFRLWLERYQPSGKRPHGFRIRLLNRKSDAEAVQTLYAKRHMVAPGADFVWAQRKSRVLTYLVAEGTTEGKIVGVITGVDHVEAFGDPEKGTSLWALSVDPQATSPGIGEALVRHLAEYFQARGRAYLDLSVMHDNSQAIRLYERLGFERVPIFALKNKNAYNEPLFVGEVHDHEGLNPYATLIVDEARRRGIMVDVLDADAGYFRLSFGGRSVVCRESLTELTHAVAMSRCDDKQVTHRVVAGAGLRVPDQTVADTLDRSTAFLERHGSVVVKPARGEQGSGITVDVRDAETLERAIASARQVSEDVLLEEFAAGDDLRVIVIDFKVVAAAVRRPPKVIGTGLHSISELIGKQSRRRAAATGGESRIPVDEETERCVREAGYSMDDVLPSGDVLQVRRTANLHTGGTIEDVTDQLHPVLAEAAVKAARAIDIPVTGLDFIVPDVAGPDYVFIEANERPGLANHEPRPTAERFMDLLFPQTAKRG